MPADDAANPRSPRSWGRSKAPTHAAGRRIVRAVLPLRRVSSGSTLGRLGRLAVVTKQARGASEVSDDGQLAHASVAARASFDIDAKGAPEQLAPGAIARAVQEERLRQWQQLASSVGIGIGSRSVRRSEDLVTPGPRAILEQLMSALPADAPLSYEEYLQFEDSVDSRHEFIDGDIFAMAGGTRRHAVLKSRLSARLTIGLGEHAPCRVEDSDTRIVVERGAKLNAYYPDMVVICREGQTHSRDPDGGVVNPRLIAEVTSPNTEKRDRGVKLDDYRLISSLSEYLIVSHVRHEIEIWTRAEADAPWLRRVVTAGQAVELDLGVALNVDDLYRDPLPPR